MKKRWKFRTWHAETAVVAAVLAGVALGTGNRAREWLGACAVLFTFGHASVSNRLAEREALKVSPDVACHRWAMRYFVAKEVCWLAYFVTGRSWSALVGVFLFLLHPVWRRWYRGRYPLDRVGS